MAKRERGDWIRGIAIAIFTAFIVEEFLSRARSPTKRGAGKVVPSVVPDGLPPFPGTGWEPYLPVTPSIANRAKNLLFQLWRTGEGATTTEKTNGEWCTYQAQTHVEAGKRKHGVGVWRLKAGAHGALG